MHPSKQHESGFDKNTPEIFAATALAALVLVGAIFVICDLFVEKRNRKIVENAAKSNAIVTQLFPGALRDQMIKEQEDKQKQKLKTITKAHLCSLVNGGAGMEIETFDGSKPLAEPVSGPRMNEQKPFLGESTNSHSKFSFLRSQSCLPMSLDSLLG